MEATGPDVLHVSLESLTQRPLFSRRLIFGRGKVENGKMFKVRAQLVISISSCRPTVPAWNIFKLAAEQIMALHEGKPIDRQSHQTRAKRHERAL